MFRETDCLFWHRYDTQRNNPTMQEFADILYLLSVCSDVSAVLNHFFFNRIFSKHDFKAIFRIYLNSFGDKIVSEKPKNCNIYHGRQDKK